MHRRFSRSYPGIDALVLANSVLAAGSLTAGFFEGGLGGFVVRTRRRHSGYCRAFACSRLIERGESLRPLCTGFVHAVCGDELLGQQRLYSFQMIVGILKLSFQASDLGVGHYRIHFAAGPPPSGGIYLGLCLGYSSPSLGRTVFQPFILSTRQSHRRFTPPQRDLLTG